MATTVSDSGRPHRRRRTQADLAALGELALEAIHELNNPLTVIAGIAGALARPRAQPATAADLRTLAAHARRACRIVRSTLARRQARPAADVNRALLRAARAAGFATTQVERALDPSLPPAAASPDELESAFTNVLLNARRAIQSSACQKVNIETRCARGRIMALIEDRGPGIPRGQRARIFDPLYTRAPQAAGTGLGLFIAQRTLQRRGGRVRLQRSQSGAAFVLDVPAADRAGSRGRARGRAATRY